MSDYNNVPEGFLKEEIRSDFCVTEKMKKVWAVELEMLGELERVCQKYHLKYYADSGTLLGAVRHQGFIPWDDDIDVVMMRDDYTKLLEIASEEFHYPLFFQCAYTDIDYYRGHAQLRYSESTAILPHEAGKVKFNQGIFLDIFPLDYSSKSFFYNWFRDKKLQYYHMLLNFSMYGYQKSNVWIKNLLKKIIWKRYCNKDMLEVYRKVERISSRNFFSSNCLDKISYYHGIKRYRYLSEKFFEKTIYLPFEYTKIAVPASYDNILRAYYGENYMEPAHNKSGHGDLILNTEETYKKTLERIKKNENN